MEMLTQCCYAEIEFKGIGKGLWCSKCKKETYSTIDKMITNKIELTYGSFSADNGSIEIHNYVYDEKITLTESFLQEVERVLKLDGTFKIGGKSIETEEIEIHGFKFLDRTEVGQFLNWFDKVM